MDRGIAAEELTRQYVQHIEALSRKTDAALAAEGFDSVVIHSGSLVKRSEFDDQYWPLRAVPHFQHWAHLEWPDCAIHYAAGKKPRLLFFRDQSFWERVPEPDWNTLAAALQLVELRSPLGFAGAIDTKKKTAFIGENTARASEWGFVDDDVNPKGLLARLDELRVHKSDYEISCLREANRIAATGHRAVKRAFDGGERSELNLHLAFLAATLQDDPETPYKNIVAIGESAAILHHVHYRRRPVNAHSMLLDAGATFRGYASDVTRTYVADGAGEAGALFRTLLERVERLQLSLVESARVGRPYESLHDEAHERLAGALTDLGIARMSAEACVTSGVSRKFLPHGLGHSLGLQTHDVGCARVRPRPENPFLRNTRVIEPDQVFTIEPGVYFIDTFMEELRAGPEGSAIDWKKVEALKAFGGIRIEDDVVVGRPEARPTENLTRDAGC